MVEYALLLAGTSLGSMTAVATAFISGLDWHALLYAALALVGLRIVWGAFKLRV